MWPHERARSHSMGSYTSSRQAPADPESQQAPDAGTASSKRKQRAVSGYGGSKLGAGGVARVG